jgi:hypothetical protein
MTNFQDLQKIIPYNPKSAPTPNEERIQREGIIKNIVSDLTEK